MFSFSKATSLLLLMLPFSHAADSQNPRTLRGLSSTTPDIVITGSENMFKTKVPESLYNTLTCAETDSLNNLDGTHGYSVTALGEDWVLQKKPDIMPGITAPAMTVTFGDDQTMVSIRTWSSGGIILTAFDKDGNTLGTVTEAPSSTGYIARDLHVYSPEIPVHHVTASSNGGIVFLQKICRSHTSCKMENDQYCQFCTGKTVAATTTCRANILATDLYKEEGLELLSDGTSVLTLSTAGDGGHDDSALASLRFATSSSWLDLGENMLTLKLNGVDMCDVIVTVVDKASAPMVDCGDTGIINLRTMNPVEPVILNFEIPNVKSNGCPFAYADWDDSLTLETTFVGCSECEINGEIQAIQKGCEAEITTNQGVQITKPGPAGTHIEFDVTAFLELPWLTEPESSTTRCTICVEDENTVCGNGYPITQLEDVCLPLSNQGIVVPTEIKMKPWN